MTEAGSYTMYKTGNKAAVIKWKRGRWEDRAERRHVTIEY